MKIVAIGDSITEGYPYSNQESWVEHLAQEVKCQVLNQGICGDFTSGMLNRFQRDVLDHAPTHVIILGGANDAYEKIPIESVSANFKAMDECCRQSGITPIFGLPTPSLLLEEEQYLIEYRKWLKSYANENGILVVDFYSPFLSRINASQGEHLFVDEVHPSIEGYALMGEVVVQSLKTHLEKRPLYIPCSAEQIVLEISDEGEAVVSGYWSPQMGLCSYSTLLKWKDGKVSVLQPLSHLKCDDIKAHRWDSYFLMPGWIDAHVHLALDSHDFYKCLENWAQPSLIEDNMQEFLLSYLKRGIVAIRDGGDLPGFAWKARNKVNEGAWLGPSVISVHEAVTRKGMYGRFLGRSFQDSAEWREKESEFFNQGLDQLKVVVTGLIKFDEFRVVGPTQWSTEELVKIVESAHQRGILVMAHASGEEGISVAIAAGVDSIEHGYYMTTEHLERMREKGIAWVPTVAPIGNILKYPTDRYISHEMDILKRILEGQLATIHQAYHLNVRLGVGTDAGAFQVPHAESLFDEMDWMVQAGIPRYEVYRMVTYGNAQILGRTELGRLDIGTPMSLLQLADKEIYGV